MRATQVLVFPWNGIPGRLRVRTRCRRKGQRSEFYTASTALSETLYHQWTYLGRYKSVHLPGGEMRLSEWLALDDEVSATRLFDTPS